MILPHEMSAEQALEACDKYEWIIPPSEMNWLDGPALDEQYAHIFQQRALRIQKRRSEMMTDPLILQKMKRHYRNNKIQFIIDWGVTFDPRRVGDQLTPLTPFIPFPKQIAALEAFEWSLKNKEYLLLEKSRDSGATWLAIALWVTYWLYEPGFVAGFGSRKEEYIDKQGDPKSIFWRVRKFIQFLPVEFQPPGFIERKHSLHMRIINPENSAVITGEAGDNIGRGDRTTVYVVDEAAFLERALTVDAALSATTNCRIDISTSNGAGTPFYAKSVSGNLPVFRFHWSEDPRKDRAWYDDQKRKLDPVVLAQEVDIDHNAATSDNFISGADVETAMQQDASKITPDGPTYLSIDAAHFGDDKSVITLRQGRVVFFQKKFTHLDGPALAGIAIMISDDHPGEVDQIAIELDGPGVSCFDQLKLGRYANITLGLHTGKRLNDGKNYNLRARMYRKLRDWLNNYPVYLPRDLALKAQLASIPYEYRDGKLLLKSKKDMKGTGFKSPDEGDSLALGFAVECNDYAQMGWKPEDLDMYHIPEAVSVFDQGRL
jgi:phage terminase large subunit